MATQKPLISYISVSKSNYCDGCDDLSICRDVLIYNSQMKFICKTEGYNEPGTWKKTCKFCAYYSSQYEKMVKRIEASELKAIKDNGIEPPPLEHTAIALFRRCSKCQKEVHISCHLNKELIYRDDADVKACINKEILKDHMFSCERCF